MRFHYFRLKIFKLYLPTVWFEFDPRVNMIWVPNLNERYIPDADFVIACPVLSAMFVLSYPANKGRKFYFIQGFEDWTLKKEDVEKTWKFPLRKIVIAKWLQDIANNLGENVVYIPNGLDFSFFKVTVPFKNRPTHSILFISHVLELKGTRFAIEASKKLKALYPHIIIRTFSAYSKPANFPEFIEFHQNPSQESIRKLYNSSSIFLSPSLSEGWPLPPAEAMLCGCVVLATDIGGHREYIEDEINGYLCLPGSADPIVERIEWILANKNKAEKVSDNAPDSLRRFDWDSRVKLFEQALLSG